MAAAAKKNGTPLVSLSPYRSYKQQEKLFNAYAGWWSRWVMNQIQSSILTVIKSRGESRAAGRSRG